MIELHALRQLDVPEVQAALDIIEADREGAHRTVEVLVALVETLAGRLHAAEDALLLSKLVS